MAFSADLVLKRNASQYVHADGQSYASIAEHAHSQDEADPMLALIWRRYSMRSSLLKSPSGAYSEDFQHVKHDFKNSLTLEQASFQSSS